MNTTTQKKAINKFDYLGHTFTPLRNFKKVEIKDGNIIGKFKGIGIDNYNGGLWDYEEFYKISDSFNNERMDIFIMDNGKLVIPCENSLFEYIK